MKLFGAGFLMLCFVRVFSQDVASSAEKEIALLNANPLENISNTMQIEEVMLNKNWLPKPYIEQSLKKLEKSI